MISLAAGASKPFLRQALFMLCGGPSQLLFHCINMENKTNHRGSNGGGKLLEQIADRDCVPWRLGKIFLLSLVESGAGGQRGLSEL